MKKLLLILLLPITLFLVSCGSENQNSQKIKLDDESTNTVEKLVTEPKLSKEKLLIEQLSQFVVYLNQFEGNAFIGALDGRCYMTFFSNPNEEYITKLRYQIDNYYQAKQDKVDETHTVDSLERRSAKKDGFGISNTDNFSNIFLKGKTSGLKASLNDGIISDMNSTGDIWFLLDSVDHKLVYFLTYSTNCRFNGNIDLDLEQHVKIKELFMNRKLSKKEEAEILKSNDIFEITSNDLNFISLGENKYKVLISKSKLIENAMGQKSAITPLFTCLIKNISDKKIDFIYLSTAYKTSQKTSLPYSYEATSTIGQHYGTGQGKGVKLFFYDSWLFDYSDYYSINDTKILNSLRKDIELKFNLNLDNPLNENTITGLSPSITIQYIHELDRKMDKQFLKEEYQIYFEFVDEINGVETSIYNDEEVEDIEDVEEEEVLEEEVDEDGNPIIEEEDDPEDF